jgi:hypothetical protein
MGLAATAVIISRSEKDNTISTGLISNEPWLKSREKPLMGSVSTINAKTGKQVAFWSAGPADPKNHAEQEEFISRFFETAWLFLLGEWKASTPKSGTSVLLCDLQRTNKIQLLPDPEDPTDLRVFDVSDKTKPITLSDRNPGERPGMDSSLRKALALMFKKSEHQQLPAIVLCGVPVVQRCLVEELASARTYPITVDGTEVTVTCGTHSESEKEATSGAMMYTDCPDPATGILMGGVLIESYAKKSIGLPPADNESAVLMVVSLPKKSLEPNENKRSYNWQTDNFDIKTKLLQVHNEYRTYLAAEDAKRFPFRKPLLETADNIDAFLDCRLGSGADNAGGTVGLRRKPDDAFFNRVVVKDGDLDLEPYSLAELRQSIATDGCRTQADFEKKFKNVIRWHTRWHEHVACRIPKMPLTELHSRSVNEIESAARSTVTRVRVPESSTGRVSIKAVLTQQILELFDDVSRTHPAVASTAEGLVSAMAVLNGIKEKDMLKSGGKVMVPHDEVIEILFEAHKLRNVVLGGNAKKPGVLAKNIASHGVIGDVSEPWLSCNECGKWRIVESYEYMERYSGTAIWRCQDGGGDWKTLPNPCSAPESCSRGHTTIAPAAAAPAAAAAAGAARSPSPSYRPELDPRLGRHTGSSELNFNVLKGILKRPSNSPPPGWKPMGGDARGQKRRAHGGSHDTTASRQKMHRVE